MSVDSELSAGPEGTTETQVGGAVIGGLVWLVHGGPLCVLPGPRCGRPIPLGHRRQGGWLAGACSEHSGDDGEGHSGAAGLQLQGRQEALRGCCVIALSLQDLAQPVPDLMGRGVHLHCVAKNLLR